MKLKSSSVIGTTILAASIGLLASGTALAQGAPKSQGVYIYGAVGQSRTDLGKGGLDAALTGVGVTGLSSSVDETDIGYKLLAGYMFNKYLGVEGGWVDLGKFTYSASFTGPVAGTMKADIKASGFNLAAIGALPISDSFSVFLKVGTIDASLKGTATATGSGTSATGSVKDTSWKGNYGIGVMYNFNANLAIRAEWERFAKLGDKNTTGEGDVDLLSVGLKYAF